MNYEVLGSSQIPVVSPKFITGYIEGDIKKYEDAMRRLYKDAPIDIIINNFLNSVKVEHKNIIDLLSKDFTKDRNIIQAIVSSVLKVQGFYSFIKNDYIDKQNVPSELINIYNNAVNILQDIINIAKKNLIMEKAVELDAFVVPNISKKVIEEQKSRSEERQKEDYKYPKDKSNVTNYILAGIAALITYYSLR